MERPLGYHPHVHLLITGGGITPDGQHWEAGPGRVPRAGRVFFPARSPPSSARPLQANAPEVLAGLPADVWQREWVSFVKHYGHGNDAVLNYLSRYVFRTAISNARILGMDQTHVMFRWKDRKADAWRTERLPGVEFLRRFLQHVLPRGFHKVRYYGLWHPSKRTASARAWLLLILETPADTAEPLKLADLLELLGQPTEPTDRPIRRRGGRRAGHPRCPHCGSSRTRLLGEYRRCGVP